MTLCWGQTESLCTASNVKNRMLNVLRKILSHSHLKAFTTCRTERSVKWRD